MKERICFTLLLLLLPFLTKFTQSDHAEDNWIEPNAWSRVADDIGLDILQMQLDPSNSRHSKCQNTDADDAVALIYFKKFIANLFARQKMQFDASLSVYQRTLLFTLMPAQLERLEQLTDPRDLDGVLTEIFAAARTPYWQENGMATDFPSGGGMGVAALLLDIFKDFVQLLKMSEVRFCLFLLIAILAGWLVHRRFHIGIITVALGGIFLFGYIHTYLECNRELEVKQMLEVLESEESITQAAQSWYSPITNWFGSSQPAKPQTRHERIRKSSKLNLAFCRPDHVLLMYGNDMFLKQLEVLLEKCTSTIIVLRENLSFPFNYMAAAMLLAMIAYVIKLTFKYILSPSAWASLLHRPPTQPQHPSYAHHNTSGVAAIHEDRLSGENLKLLLNAISAPSIVVNNAVPSLPQAPQQTISSVQEVLEQLEAATNSSDTSTYSSSSNSPFEDLEDTKELSDNGASGKESPVKSKIVLEDAPDE